MAIGGKLSPKPSSLHDPEKPVAFHRLAYRVEGDEVTVGRTDIDSYAVFPRDGAELVRKLADGATPSEATRWYNATYGTTVDVADLLERLSAFGFLRDEEESATTDRPIRWQRLGRAAFSPAAWAGYGLLLSAATVAMVRSPDLLPSYRNIFFTDYYTLITVVIFVAQIPAVLVHEAFHALAGRRLGLRSRLSVGRRFYFVVFETSLDGLVMVPRRKRYLPFLAGMLADLLFLAGFTLMAQLGRNPDDSLPWHSRLFLALAFSTLLRLVWQFYLYLQTDIYFLISTVLGCDDLHGAARALLRSRVDRLFGRAVNAPGSGFSVVDRRAARWYSWLLVAGYGFSIATLLLSVVPMFDHVLRGLYHRVSHSDHANDVQLLDSAVFLLISVAQLAFAASLAWRARRRRTHDSHIPSLEGVS